MTFPVGAGAAKGAGPMREAPFVASGYREAGEFLYQPVITPTRWTIL